jgi:hypothetical protein
MDQCVDLYRKMLGKTHRAMLAIRNDRDALRKEARLRALATGPPSRT